MNVTFTSVFAEHLVGFLKQKRALGYSFSNTSDFRLFDQMCAKHFPNESRLTAALCNAWASARETESIKTTNRRLPFIREFARYLIQIGEQAYILPNGRIKRGQRYIPHIYSQDEISELWHIFSDIRPTRTYPAAHIVLPALIRLLYCCGLRPSEALNLKTEDVDILSGKLFIAQSKGNKDRIVMLSEDVRRMCRNYDAKINENLPGRRYFFPKNTESPCGYSWVALEFRTARKKLGFKTANDKPPRLYDLRHTFATHRLYQWMRGGNDLYVMLPYLSSYMGHSKVSETFYYIHLVPGMFEAMSGFEYGSVADIFPEAVDADEQFF